MKKRLFLLLIVASMGWAAWADEPDVMVVYKTDNALQTWALEDVQRITFHDENEMLVHTAKGDAKPVALDDVARIEFLLASEIPSDVEETIAPVEESGTRKVWENGQIIIIKDGKRYTLLGVRI